MNIIDIGTGDLALLCITDLQECCGNPWPRHGEWYFPNNERVLTEGSNNANFYRNRDDSVVRLNRRNNATMPVREYCCELPNAENDNIIMLL